MSHDPAAELRTALDHAAHLLPAQGPISVFIHHNTLHAFEHLPFEQAVVEAGALYGCEPFLSEGRYREDMASGRIRGSDIEHVLDTEIGPGGAEPIAGIASRRDLRRMILRHPIERARGQALAWLLAETPALRRLRDDLGPAARARLLESSAAGASRWPAARERRVAEGLWRAAERAAARAPMEPRTPPPAVRHRDVWLGATGEDSDDLVHPILIRIVAAFLDQGLAQWPMPDREAGLYPAFLRLYAAPGLAAERGLVGLRDLLRTEIDQGRDAASSVLASLAALGVGPEERDLFVRDTVLALRGWAGILYQFEVRPDRAPVAAPPTSLLDFLAVRLLIERIALTQLMHARPDRAAPLDCLRDRLRALQPPSETPTRDDIAWLVFQTCQLLGCQPEILDARTPAEIADLVREIEAATGTECRRFLHLAYERRHATAVLDAMAAASQAPLPAAATPAGPDAWQAIFCIDEREESMRRHLEEVDRTCETFGAPGFFGVAMYYQGAGDAHLRPLAPIAIRPRHEVVERLPPQLEPAGRRRAWWRRLVGHVVAQWREGSRTFARGTLLTGLFGAAAGVPLVGRVLFPGLMARLERHAGRLLGPPATTELALDREDGATTLGEFAGYTKDEMADLVQRLIEDAGLRDHLTPLVLVVGHGSSSLNNPHESAHDCGACGGGRGGPNARAITRMANDPAVRARLATRGLTIPDATWFVGAYHNTCNDAVAFYDLDRVPPSARARLDAVRVALDQARERDAHERCRRFANVPAWAGPGLAQSHVEARAEDLAQPRPEYGHATNAVCVVGRRARTRGLFLDRRAFLVSYDPASDDAHGTVLARVLRAAAPVVAGISLEYYFSFVDPAGYGSGTKLPHNITSLLGVMDGYQSDLRTGLPWQMTEIHEPVRLLLVVEAPLDRLTRVIEADDELARLVQNRWVRLAALDPAGPAVHVHRDGAFMPYVPVETNLPQVTSSAAWYGGRREHLPCARIGPVASETR